jgi:Flp pilus assembly pilin Flp
MCRRVGRWLADERGQDLIEYALITGASGLVGVAACPRG